MGIMIWKEGLARRLRRASALVLCLLLVLALLPGRALADGADAPAGAGEVVRVGWYESAFNRTDRYARRSGYAYEFQRKIAAYTGWRYEYVYGSWPELMEKLRSGEIDLMSDVSYTPERAGQMLFSSLPMGTEAYYVFTAPGNTLIRSEEPATLSGKTVGVNRGSFQKDLFLEWAKKHDVRVHLVEMRDQLAPDANVRHRPLLLKEIDKYVTVHTGYKGLEVTAEGIWCENAEGERVLVPGTSVICALGQRSRTDVVEALMDTAPYVRVIGDASRVSTITNAVYWGHYAALDI